MVCYPYGYAQNNYSHSIGYSACSQRNRIPHRPDTDSDAAAKYLVAAEASKKALISFDYRHEISYFRPVVLANLIDNLTEFLVLCLRECVAVSSALGWSRIPLHVKGQFWRVSSKTH